MRYFLPLIVFITLAIFLGVGLRLNPREVPSPLVGKMAPEFILAKVEEPDYEIQPKDMLGKVWLLNVWATWCSGCRAEHQALLELGNRNIVPIYGLDYKDNLMAAQKWLRDFGNPYHATAYDQDGKVGIDYGVYGVPETYVIDRTGVIRQKHIGPLTREIIETKILPLVRELQK